MALEISTAGVALKYAVETTAGTRPTTGYTAIPNIKETPDFNPEPSTLEVTDLSDLVWKRYIAGLKDPGGALSFTANLTSAFKTAWETLVSAYETAAASSKATWFEISVPRSVVSTSRASPPNWASTVCPWTKWRKPACTSRPIRSTAGILPAPNEPILRRGPQFNLSPHKVF